jgi:hypothetical protein
MSSCIRTFDSLRLANDSEGTRTSLACAKKYDSLASLNRMFLVTPLGLGERVSATLDCSGYEHWAWEAWT